jgi:hypothetical protein
LRALRKYLRAKGWRSTTDANISDSETVELSAAATPALAAPAA